VLCSQYVDYVESNGNVTGKDEFVKGLGRKWLQTNRDNMLKLETDTKTHTQNMTVQLAFFVSLRKVVSWKVPNLYSSDNQFV
jgi:hypothetical protein